MKWLILGVVLISIIVMGFSSYALIRRKQLEKYHKEREEELKEMNFGEYLDFKGTMDKIGRSLPTSQIEVIFNRSKNPWNMRIETFQAMRIIGSIIGLILIPVGIKSMGGEYGWIPGVFITGIAWFYPTYYYTAIGNEREEQFNKLYEFIWVIDSNTSLYDSKRALLNTKNYLEENAPHNEYMIEFFGDFYEHWDDNQIPEYIRKYYPFSIPKEVANIIFNSQAIGQSPKEQLDQLRIFITNVQDKAVVKTLGGVSTSATVASLPFMMLSVILAMLVPMLMQFLQQMN